MTILFLTYYWPPSGGPGVQRSLKFVKYLPKFDIQPIVITIDEKFASYPVIQSDFIKEIPENIVVVKTKSLEPLNIYKNLNKRGEIPYSGFVNESEIGFFHKIFRFIRGNLFIPDARKGWNKFAYKAAKEIISKKKIDLIFISTPPHSTQLLGLKLKKETGIPVIADMRDPWTDIFYYKMFYQMGFAKRKDKIFEKNVLENSDAVLVVSESMKSRFLLKSDKINADKIHIIPNGFDEEDFKLNTSENREEFTITYAGSITEDYGIDSFIAVYKNIIEKHTDIKIRLRFIGVISESLKNKFIESGLESNIEFKNYVPHKESIKSLLESTTLLLAIPKIENNEGILTGKLFEYLASKKPIICIGPENGDAARIINDCKAGKVFDYSKENEVENYISELILMWSQNKNLENSDNNYLKYSRIKQAETLSFIIKKLAGKK